MSGPFQELLGDARTLLAAASNITQSLLHPNITEITETFSNVGNNEAGDYHWAIGVILAAIAAVISNLGLNFQKLTHIQNSDKGDHAKQNYYKSKLWMAGLAMIILGSVADFAALAFGAQSIIAPLGSLTLVCNVFFAPCLLGETLTVRDVLSTITIMLGATIAVAFASHKDTIYDLEQLFGFYEQPRFGLYAIAIMVAMGVLWSAIQYMETIRREGPHKPQYARMVKYHRFCLAALSGTVGAQSVLFAKCIAELVVNTVMGQGFLLAYYQTYLLLICMCSTIFLQLKWLNQGLERFDALYIVPVFQSFWILVSVLAGLIFFGEFSEMSPAQRFMFPVGIMFTISGVYFLSQRGVDEDLSGSAQKSIYRQRASSKDKGPEEEEEPKEEHARAPLIADKGPSPRAPGPSPRGGPKRDPRRQMPVHQRIDSTVGFGGTGSPAAMLPTRAMVVGASLRPENRDEEKTHNRHREEEEDDEYDPL